MTNKFLKTLHILVVEDEVKLSTLLKNAIGDSFARFSLVQNGQEGLEYFLKYKPDIIISDIMMPQKTGLEMAQEIKSIDKNIPIIILSAYSDTDKLLNAIDIGVVKYFIKPFDLDELLEYIKSLEYLFLDQKVVLAEDFIFNIKTKTLYKKNRYIPLNKKSLQLMELLVSQSLQGKHLVSYEEIKDLLWGEMVSDERLRTFMRRFREKTSKELVKNIKGQGYSIVCGMS